MNTVSTTASASASTKNASAWKVLRFPSYLITGCSKRYNLLTVPLPEIHLLVKVPVKISRYLYGNIATLEYIDGMDFHCCNSSERVPISMIVDAFSEYQTNGEVIRDFPRELTYNFSAQKCATCEELLKWVDATFSGDTPLRVYELWDEKKLCYDIKQIDGVWRVFDHTGTEMGLTRLISLKGCVIDTHNDPWLLPIRISDTLKKCFKLFLEKGGSQKLVNYLRVRLEKGLINERTAFWSLHNGERELSEVNE